MGFPVRGLWLAASRAMAIEQGPSCQNCHASRVQTQYVKAEDLIETRVKSFSIGVNPAMGRGVFMLLV